MFATKGIPFLATLLRVVVAVTFLIAATLKFEDPVAFAEQIANYQLFPEVSNIIAAFLPSIEIVASLVLIFGKGSWRFASAVTILGLLAVFTVAIVRAWALGINLECGCFGEGSADIGIVPVLRNLSLFAALCVAVFLECRRQPNAGANLAHT